MNLVIVEDSELIRSQLIRLLARQPRVKVVGIATEEEEAVNLIVATQPDAILLDLALSPGSGVRVLERIREAGCGARVIVLTNNIGSALREACLKLGANGFFDKTTEASECFELLYSWLPPLPKNEAQRLATLQETRLLDSPEEEVFDDLTHLAATIAEVPIAVVSLIDQDRQWFLSHFGLQARETSRSIAFCAHAILHNEMLEIPDALEDSRFRDNPLVVGAPNIRFYAGVPLTLVSGEALGTLCVIDNKPRQLTPAQRQALKTLASCVLSEIELRRRVIYLEQEVERRRLAEAHVLHLATRDPLTALPNRATFRDRLDQHLRLASRGKAGLAVLFIDLDRFKPINDTLGHDIGDDALVVMAERLSACLRCSDTVARLGGDEFAVVLPEVAGSVDALQVADKIITTLSEPLTVQGHALHISASIGAAIFPEHGQSGDQLLRHADLAMYQAKKSGGGRTCLFAQHLSDRAEETQTLDHDLRNALANQELLLHFQPQSALGQGRLCGVEALVRWQHPRFGLLSPDHFIPLAEERGLIHELGRQVLDMALGQMKRWDEAGIHIPRIAVNVSPSEIRPDFAETIEAALFRHGISPHRLELEITESMLTADGITTISMLNRLRASGVTIAVDDFGVGYSSLGQLRRLPIDSLKVDRSFVREIEHSPHDIAIVRAIVTMAEALGLRTTAEGAEEEGQMTVLEELGCDCVQGYFLCHPLPAQEMTEWMQIFEAAAADPEPCPA
ncbi:MAG: EAL domain-containing protein [Zoogloea sp.]|nr:EAL domain-containing protein [Zoogloea sp.]